MNENRLRVAVIGTGMVAQVMHLPHLQSLPNLFEIVALCDLSPKTAQHLANMYDVDRVFVDFEEMLQVVELDAALILTPNHFPVAMAALASGVHIFVEKPMAINVGEAVEMVNLATNNQLVGQIGYHKPHDPGLESGAEMVQAMANVRLATMNIAHGPNQPFLEHYEVVRFDDIDQGRIANTSKAMRDAQYQAIGEQPQHISTAYGSLLGGGCHQLSIMRCCLGRVEEVLSTEIWNNGRSLASTLVFEKGIRCVFTSVFMPDIRLFDERFTAYGDSQSVEIRFPSPFLVNAPTNVVTRGMEDTRYVERQITTNYFEAFRNELIHFHQSVTSGKPIRTPLTDGALDAEVMIEIVRKCPDFVT